MSFIGMIFAKHLKQDNYMSFFLSVFILYENI